MLPLGSRHSVPQSGSHDDPALGRSAQALRVPDPSPSGQLNPWLSTLVDMDRIILGVIDAPFLDLRYHAVAEEGAYLHSEPSVSTPLTGSKTP